MNQFTNPWSAERKEEVARLWKGGLSATQIASELGAPYITRNAVIGVIHRSKLHGQGARKMGQHRTGPLNPPRASRAKPKTHTFVNAVAINHNREARKRIVTPPEPKICVAAPAPLRIHLLDLKFHHCRWPIGDPQSKDFAFCGLDKAEIGGSYCAWHHDVAYLTAQPKRLRAA